MNIAELKQQENLMMKSIQTQDIHKFQVLAMFEIAIQLVQINEHLRETIKTLNTSD